MQVCAKDVPPENLRDFALMVGGVINTMMRRAIVLGTSEAEARRLSKVELDWLLIGVSTESRTPPIEIKNNSPA